ncbi:hypothetical protein GA707_02435 [Nostocoides sp. F2B08]|uniref:ABC transporter permease n=1 Tax=Nostocoides sp. F2B08 TaxID=2653936 RepID=UPI001262B14E|nr:hypothetical protein [Tetrasphaera sp. F2B08]KAB7746383.1 hypothetical protein GA707_02435 [Tetrasphaera sp. F2B08]
MSPSHEAPRSRPLAGTGHLVRLILRRDRVRLPIWLMGLAGVTAASANAVIGLYDTPEERAGYRATVENSAVTRLMAGIPYDTDTLGGIISYELTALTGIVVSLMVIFLVVRHTRAEEESGSAELVRSAAIGRHAAIAATLSVALGAAVVAGLLESAVLIASGIGSGPALLFGAGVAGLGLVFTAVAAAAAQLTSSARAALGIAGAVLAVFLVLRGVGAIDETALTWLSPFGWQDAIRPFGESAEAWPLLLMLGLSIVFFALASWLVARRDFGAGLLRGRPGRTRAAAGLAGPTALALRQQRGLLLGWAVGLGLLSIVFGGVGREMQTMIESNPDIAAVIAGSVDDITRGYFAYVMTLLGVTTSAFAVSSALRLRHAEESGHAENVLATAVSRSRWAWSGIAVTAAGTTALLLVVSLVTSVSHAVVSGDRALLWPVVRAGLVTLPGALVLAGFAVLLHAWAPRWALLAWAPVAWAFVQAYLGELLDLPGVLAGLSPFWHLPRVPVEATDAAPVVLLSALAVVLAIAGVLGLRRRDLATT